ncbi:MAG: hypothetical protein MN733_24510 [Nitrososphaera sp.]|nr:hypothetical protein [Nitrososphaera sp.]
MDKDELLKLEHATLLEEFRAARENMLFDVGLSRQIINITLTAAGILVVGAPYIIQSDLPTLFLIAPLVFYPLAWSQIRYLHISNVISQYLLTVLIPRIQRVLKELSPDKDRDFDSIMSWEAYLGAAERRYGLILLPIAGGNYGINLLAVMFSICGYFVVVYEKSQPITTLDLILIIINVILLLYSIGLGFWSRFSSDTSRLSEAILTRQRGSK